ncbi:MAG: hypothetical protein AAFO06_05765 [Cyanobacteria bacterium J06597_16]
MTDATSAALPEPTAKAAESEASATTPSLLEVTLSGAIALIKDGRNYEQATVQFEALLTQVSKESPAVAPLLKTLWKEYVSGQRSASFYESLSDAEKDLSDKMAKSNIQLKQNYMRLIQEQ